LYFADSVDRDIVVFGGLRERRSDVGSLPGIREKTSMFLTTQMPRDCDLETNFDWL
jgi:hypothetical protein